MPELPEKLTVEPEEVMTTVGKVVNPLPPFKLVYPVIEPPAPTTPIAEAPEPPPPTKVIRGATAYLLPALFIVNEAIEVAGKFAVAVNPVPPFGVVIDIAGGVG